jgi:hypothetical protein
MKRPDKQWIQEAVQHEGVLKQYARKMDKLTSTGTINVQWLMQLAQRNDIVGHRSRLALTLRKLRNQ